MSYAIKTMPYVMMTNGGVAMNENANIIREDGTPSSVCIVRRAVAQTISRVTPLSAAWRTATA